MGLDALSPVAPARIRCLALPCGKITRSRFLAFVKRLQHETVVRLGDVSPNAGPTRSKLIARKPAQAVFETMGQTADYALVIRYVHPLGLSYRTGRL